MRREGETKERTEGGGGGGLGPPDLDLDLVEEEVQKEEIRRRSQTVRQKVKRGRQREQGSRSRSLPRNSAPSWDTSLPEERVEVEPEGRAKERWRRSEMKSRRRATEADREEKGGREKREGRTASQTKHSGSSVPAQRSAFSFLRPLDDIEHQRLSDSESADSFSEVSLSAASITTAGWREDSDWRGAKSPWEQKEAPGPWLKPNPQRMTQVLVASRLSGRELAGGLSL